MQFYYIIIFNEIMKYRVKVNKTYKYNVVIAGILSMVLSISKKVVIYLKMLGVAKYSIIFYWMVRKSQKIFCMAPKELICKL